MFRKFYVELHVKKIFARTRRTIDDLVLNDSISWLDGPSGRTRLLNLFLVYTDMSGSFCVIFSAFFHYFLSL